MMPIFQQLINISIAASTSKLVRGVNVFKGVEFWFQYQRSTTKSISFALTCSEIREKSSWCVWFSNKYSNKKVSKHKFDEEYFRISVLCLYRYEFCKHFTLVLQLSVPFIVYLNLVQPIIRVPRYCLELHPMRTVCEIAGRVVLFIPNVLGLVVWRPMLVDDWARIYVL